jgi:hypothetical protein
MPADLVQNVKITFELTLLHNYLAIFYFLGLIASIGWSMYKPSRAATFAFTGFLLLLFSFEYTKHILEPLKEQTVNSVITMQEHNQARRILNLGLVKFLPTGSFIGGILCLITSGILFWKNIAIVRKK